MSALGQKQTCAAQKAMSASPLKADMNPLPRSTGLVLVRTLQRMKPSPEFASDAQVKGSSWRTKSNTPQENYFARKRTKREMSPGHSRDTLADRLD